MGLVLLNTASASWMLAAARLTQWETTEPAPHKRWAWYLGVSVIGLFGSLIALLAGEWSLAAVIAAAATALLVVYRNKPRRYRYTLTNTHLEAQPLGITGRNTRVRHWQLDSFRAFINENLLDSRGQSKTLFLLIPTARFQSAVDVYLTGNSDTDVVIGDALEKLPTFEEGHGDRPSRNALDRVARWLRLW